MKVLTAFEREPGETLCSSYYVSLFVNEKASHQLTRNLLGLGLPVSRLMTQLAFCCYYKHHDRKQLQKEMVYFRLEVIVH